MHKDCCCPEHLPRVNAQQICTVESLVHAGNLPVKMKDFDWSSAHWFHISRQIGLCGRRIVSVGMACGMINGWLAFGAANEAY